MWWSLHLMAAGLAALAGGARARAQYPLWQSDVHVRSLKVSHEHGNLTARAVIAAEIGEALGTRVEVLLPVGVGIVALGAGCTPGASPTGISELRSRVECNLGNLPARSSRELYIVTTIPSAGLARGFAVMVLSDTPDPRPGNNFLVRVSREDQAPR